MGVVTRRGGGGVWGGWRCYVGGGYLVLREGREGLFRVRMTVGGLDSIRCGAPCGQTPGLVRCMYAIPSTLRSTCTTFHVRSGSGGSRLRLVDAHKRAASLVWSRC